MKHLLGSMGVLSLLMAGCAATPSPPVEPNKHQVQLTHMGTAVSSIPGPFCQPAGQPTNLGIRCEEGRKRIEELAKAKRIPQLDSTVRVLFPGMEPPHFKLQFGEQPVRYSLTLWGANPTVDPPGALWLHSPVAVSSAGGFPVPQRRSFQLYEVQADWADGSSSFYLFPLETTQEYVDLNTFTVSEVSLGLVDGVVWVHGRSNEAETHLKPVVEALKVARLSPAPPVGESPAFTVALQTTWNLEITLAAFRGKGVLVTAGEERRWTTSAALLTALEPLGQKVPKPPLIGRERVEAIAKGFDATVKWDSPSFHERMAVTVNGVSELRAIWMAAGTHPAGHRVVLYLDPLTGSTLRVEELGKKP